MRATPELIERAHEDALAGSAPANAAGVNGAGAHGLPAASVNGNGNGHTPDPAAALAAAEAAPPQVPPAPAPGPEHEAQAEVGMFPATPLGLAADEASGVLSGHLSLMEQFILSAPRSCRAL